MSWPRGKGVRTCPNSNDLATTPLSETPGVSDQLFVAYNSSLRQGPSDFAGQCLLRGHLTVIYASPESDEVQRWTDIFIKPSAAAAVCCPTVIHCVGSVQLAGVAEYARPRDQPGEPKAMPREGCTS